MRSRLFQFRVSKLFRQVGQLFGERRSHELVDSLHKVVVIHVAGRAVLAVQLAGDDDASKTETNKRKKFIVDGHLPRNLLLYIDDECD